MGIGNALMDALVLVDHGDALIDELGLVRGTMHPVDHDGWMEVFRRVEPLGVRYESGGSCANTIATLGRLGARAVYRGQVGPDELGRRYMERMHDACGAHLVRVAESGATGKVLSLISREDAERTMLTDLGCSVLLPELGDAAAALRATKVAHFTGYTLLDGPMLGVVREAMQIAKASGARISLDVADPFVVAGIRDRLWDVIDRYVDIVFLNAEEARALTETSPEEAVRKVAAEARVETVVVKLCSRGSLVWHQGEVHTIAVNKVDAIDTTGAGDAYAGGFLYGLTHGWSPAASGALGSAAAAATVQQIGAVVNDARALQALRDDVAAAR